MDIDVEIDEKEQKLSHPLGEFKRVYRLGPNKRFTTGNYVSFGIEDKVFVVEFEYFVCICSYKTPKRDVKFLVH